MNKIKSFFTVFIIVTIITICYEYYNYDKFFGDKSLNLSDDLSIPVFNYVSKFKDDDLTNVKNLEKMKKWINITYGDFDEYKELFSCGYGIKYDEKSKFYLFFLYGVDKKMSEKNVSIKGIDESEIFSSKQPSFIHYLVNDKDYDIILFGYKKPR
jgi:hypothetical protein